MEGRFLSRKQDSDFNPAGLPPGSFGRRQMNEENKRELKNVRNVTLIFAVIFAALGILLLLLPFAVYEFLGYLIGALAVGFGIYRLVLYFMRKKSASLLAVDLFNGILLMAFGVACLSMHTKVTGYTSVIFGLLLVAGSIIKFQNAIDLFRLGLVHWWAVLILGAVSVLFGLLLLYRPQLPFLNLKDREIFLLASGIFLLYDSCSDFASVILFSVQWRRIRKGLKTPLDEEAESGEYEGAGNAEDSGYTGHDDAEDMEYSGDAGYGDVKDTEYSENFVHGDTYGQDSFEDVCDSLTHTKLADAEKDFKEMQ